MSWIRQLALLLAFFTLFLFAAQSQAAPYIVGGQNDSIRNWPYLVALVYGDYKKPYKGYLCGGALVRPRIVLTVAHCIFYDKPKGLRVIARQSDLRKKSGRLVRGVAKRVHPKYKYYTSGPDLALLKIKRPIKTNRPVLAAEVPEEGVFSVAGWGWSGGKNSALLRSASAPRVSDADCLLSYGGVFNPKFEFCAGGQGVEPCAGDSGSPLVKKGVRRTVIFGLVSAGNIECHASPTIYAKLDKAWIKRASRALLRK